MTKLQFLSLLALLLLGGCFNNTQSELVNPQKPTTLANDLFKSSQQKKIVAKKRGESVELVLTQTHLEKAIKQAYFHSKGLFITLDGVPHLVSGINPSTNNLDFGLAFTLQTSDKEYQYVIFYLIETPEGYFLSSESAGICTSITCLRCKKPLFGSCICRSGEGECYKRGEEVDLPSAFELAL